MSVLNLNYSIFIPLYKANYYIEFFCKNILIQTTKPDQIVFVDDGENSDNTFIKIKEYLKNFKNVDLVFIKNKKNLGPGKSWNNARKFFRNKLVFRMDADDLWKKDHTTVMLKSYLLDKTYLLYHQNSKPSFLKSFFYNNDQIFINTAEHSTFLFNLDICDVKYSVSDNYPIDDICLLYKIRFILKKKIKVVNENTCIILTDFDNRFSSKQDKKSTFFLRKLFFLFLKQKLSIKKVKWMYVYKIFLHFNFLRSVFIIKKILFK
jgi:glycosyltransferase involved in cell wall biosynthesis